MRWIPALASFLLVAHIVALPSVSAPPPGKCSPWPECKDGGGGGGEGIPLIFADSNIVTLDQGSAGRKTAPPPVFVWQSLDPSKYEVAWSSQADRTYHDVRIGDPDTDGQLEIVAFTSKLASSTGKGRSSPEERVFFHVFEALSTGTPDAESEFVVVDRNAWSADGLVGDVDGDGWNEVVALVSNTLIIYRHVPGQGYSADFVEGPLSVVLNDGDLGDVDNDGTLEIVSGTNEGTIYVWDWQDDAQTWTAIVSEVGPSRPLYNSRVGDIDGDGRLEVVSASFDSSTGESFVSHWRWEANAYRHVLTQTLTFEGQAHAYAFGLGDVNGNMKSELVLGTTGDWDTAKAMVFSYDGTKWAAIWEALNNAITNDVWIGDADGVPSSVELVFTGAKDGLYIEVFTWSPVDGSALSSWTFSGAFNPASDSHLG